MRCRVDSEVKGLEWLLDGPECPCCGSKMVPAHRDLARVRRPGEESAGARPEDLVVPIVCLGEELRTIGHFDFRDHRFTKCEPPG